MVSSLLEAISIIHQEHFARLREAFSFVIAHSPGLFPQDQNLLLHLSARLAILELVERRAQAKTVFIDLYGGDTSWTLCQDRTESELRNSSVKARYLIAKVIAREILILSDFTLLNIQSQSLTCIQLRLDIAKELLIIASTNKALSDDSANTECFLVSATKFLWAHVVDSLGPSPFLRHEILLLWNRALEHFLDAFWQISVEKVAVLEPLIELMMKGSGYERRLVYNVLHTLAMYGIYGILTGSLKRTLVCQFASVVFNLIIRQPMLLTPSTTLPTLQPYWFGGCSSQSHGSDLTTCSQSDFDIILLRLQTLVHFEAAVLASKFQTEGLEDSIVVICELRHLKPTQMIDLFLDQDDLLISSLVCVEEVERSLQPQPNWLDENFGQASNSDQEETPCLNSHSYFFRLLTSINWDKNVLLDWIMSPETSCIFSLFLLRYFKRFFTDWSRAEKPTLPLILPVEIQRKPVKERKGEIQLTIAILEDIGRKTVRNIQLYERLPVRDEPPKKFRRKQVPMGSANFFAFVNGLCGRLRRAQQQKLIAFNVNSLIKCMEKVAQLGLHE